MQQEPLQLLPTIMTLTPSPRQDSPQLDGSLALLGRQQVLGDAAVGLRVPLFRQGSLCLLLVQGPPHPTRTPPHPTAHRDPPQWRHHQGATTPQHTTSQRVITGAHHSGTWQWTYGRVGNIAKRQLCREVWGLVFTYVHNEVLGKIYISVCA